MLIDVVRVENWDELNDQVKLELQLTTKVRVRCYRGLGQAVYETTQALAQFLAHKKAVAFIFGQSPLLESLLPFYFKESYDVLRSASSGLINVVEWVQSLSKEMNFVVYCEDHPVTGELLPFVDELDRLLNEKRVFSLRISHSRHFIQTEELRPYTVRLCSYTADMAVAQLGERYRAPSLLAQNMNWNSSETIQNLNQARTHHSLNQAEVEKFESEILDFTQPVLGNVPRTFDRALCFMPDVSAEAVAQKLFEKLQMPAEQGWSEVETTNMCQWGSVKLFRHWWQPEPSLELLRGLLVIRASFLKTKDFAKLLRSSYEEVKAQQSWEV